MVLRLTSLHSLFLGPRCVVERTAGVGSGSLTEKAAWQPNNYPDLSHPNEPLEMIKHTY